MGCFKKTNKLSPLSVSCLFHPRQLFSVNIDLKPQEETAKLAHCTLPFVMQFKTCPNIPYLIFYD